MKIKYLILITFLLMSGLASGFVDVFPPQATYNWQQGAQNGGTTTTINNDWIYLTCKSTGGYNFAVTGTIDLTNVSQLMIDWRGDWISWNPAFYRGNITFGISSVQMDTSYTKYIAENSSDFNKTSYLDVTDYYGNYYIKVGVNVSLAGTADSMSLWVYNVTFDNFSCSSPTPITTLAETTATLKGYLLDDGGMDCTCGFWYSNISTSQAGVNAGTVTNVTCSGTYNSGDTFTKAVTGLTSGEYYYVRSWVSNNYSFNFTNGYALPLSLGNNYPIYFPDEIWDGNSSLASNKTVENFLEQSGLYDGSVDIIFSYNMTSDTWKNWIYGAFPLFNTLKEITPYSAHTDVYYWFITIAPCTLNFKFDNYSSWEQNFITKPPVPTNLNATSSGPNSIRLSWINASLGDGTENHSVYIRYKEGSPPTSRTDGTFGANESASNWTTIYGLTGDTTYYFSVWTYCNASGSPMREAFSSSYATASNTTQGGNYMFYVRYENESYSNNYLVNLSQYKNHVLNIYYSEGQDRVNFSDGITYSTISGAFWNIPNGSFNITLLENPLFFEFKWNDSNGSNMYCSRILVPSTGQRNITFYIRTNCYVFAETTAELNSTNTLLKYHYGYLDETGLFRYPNNPYCSVYKYNSTNTKLVIHSEFFDQEGKTHPWLVYDNRYYQGVTCDLLSYDRIGIAPATDDTTQDEIRIPLNLDRYYIFWDLIELNYAWGAGEFYVNYQDTTSSTVWVNFSVYYFINDTYINYSNQSANIVNFSFPCDTTTDYVFQINVSLNDDVSDYYEGYYYSGKIPMYAGMSPITSNSTLDYYFTLIFGDSPLYYYGNDNIFVPWTYVLIFMACFIVLCTFGRLNSFLGGLGVGITLIFSGATISGVQTLFSNYAWWEGPTLVVIGAFIIGLSFIGLMGGVEK